MRILIASTPVGPLGSGTGGGVELTLHSLVYGLGALGHHVEVVAPAGSLHIGERVHQIEGALQASSQLAGRAAPVALPAGSVLAAMWEHIADLQRDFDIVLNLAYDWLPLYLTRFFETPVLHLISMGSLNDAMDAGITDLAQRMPGRLAAHTLSQASTYGDVSQFKILAGGIVTDRYEMRLTADQPPYLGAIGRVSPEKGLEDVAALSERSGWPVKVWGKMQDPGYWDRILAAHPGARLDYCGFLPTDDLQAAIGGCSAVVMTPKWVEAFGNVAIEALATGVPVISYCRGGPSEIVTDGETGFLVAPDDVDGLVAAVGRLGEIDRVRCRQRVEEFFSTEAFARRVEEWFCDARMCTRIEHREHPCR